MKKIEMTRRTPHRDQPTLRGVLACAGMLLAQLGGSGCGGDGPGGVECKGSGGTLGCACRDTAPACQGDLECLSGVCVGERTTMPPILTDDGGANGSGTRDGGASGGDGGASGNDDLPAGCEPGVFDQSRFGEACFQ